VKMIVYQARHYLKNSQQCQTSRTLVYARDGCTNAAASPGHYDCFPFRIRRGYSPLRP
jgi:hypothetical protein